MPDGGSWRSCLSIVKIVMRPCTAITPARTAIAPNARMGPQNNGWSGKGICCCLCLTSWSPSHYRPISGGWYETTRSSCTVCSFALQPPLCKNWPDPRFVGGQIGMVGVLHTWNTRLELPSPCALSGARRRSSLKMVQTWLPVKKDFLVPVKPLSILFRAKFRDALKKTDLFAQRA